MKKSSGYVKIKKSLKPKEIKMENYNSDNQGREIEIRLSFIIILAVTLFLLVALTIGLFVAMHIEGKDSGIDRGGSVGGNNNASVKDDGGESTPVYKNNTPLFPTKESRDSYKISTSPNVVELKDDSFIRSNNTILVELKSDGMVSIVEKAADKKMYPASMTKVMTLLVACENVTDLNEKLTVTPEMVTYAANNDASGAGLKAGESYKVEDLLYLTIYTSDTIACLLLSEHIAGSEEAFVGMMNAKAKEIGLTGTNFANCTGLHSENNYSTCRDMAMIMSYALDNEMANKCLTSYKGREMVVGGQNCTFYSAWYSGHARFADDPRLDSVTVMGAKTGYIDESGISLVSYAVGTDGKKFINVIVGEPKGSGLSESISTKEVKKIYNTYAKKYTLTFTSEGKTLSTQRVWFGDIISEPAKPSKSGATFDAWYTDKECKTKFTFGVCKLTKDTTFYAGWK